MNSFLRAAAAILLAFSSVSHGEERVVSYNLKQQTREVDQGSAALVMDLKRRGLLEDTLVIWGGEFGRTPMSQGDNGRDHHIKSGAMFLA